MKGSDVACRAIRAASTELQVIRAVGEYLQTIEVDSLAFLPAELLGVGFSPAEELIHSALILVNREMLRLKETPAAATLSELALVFSTAARRLAVLARNTA